MSAIDSTEILKRKKIVIVGGSSGIGFAVAVASLAHGATVVISSSSETRVADAVARLGGEAGKPVSGTAVDVRDEEKLFAFLDGVGVFDHLVWTASDQVAPGYPKLNLAKHKNAFDVNFWAPAAAGQHIHEKGLIAPGGSIILTTGGSYLRPPKGWAVTGGSAGARVSLVRGMAVDLAPTRVNIISSGVVDTDYWTYMDPSEKEVLFKAVVNKQLVKHVAKAHEIAEAYIFVMKCSFITGQTVEVDGGAHLT